MPEVSWLRFLAGRFADAEPCRGAITTAWSPIRFHQYPLDDSHVREQRVRASIRRIKGLLPKFSPRPSIHREQQELRMPTTVSSANVPPFTHESAVSKVRAAEDAWNTRDPRRVCLGYTIDSRWRNRAEFVNGREEIIAFLTRKWSRELEYSLIKELWAFGAKMARTNCSRREIEELLGGAIRQ
jgi:hypothetical protein